MNDIKTEKMAWSLLNAFIEAMKDGQASNPQQFALRTMRLNELLS